MNEHTLTPYTDTDKIASQVLSKQFWNSHNNPWPAGRSEQIYLWGAMFLYLVEKQGTIVQRCSSAVLQGAVVQGAALQDHLFLFSK